MGASCIQVAQMGAQMGASCIEVAQKIIATLLLLCLRCNEDRHLVRRHFMLREYFLNTSNFQIQFFKQVCRFESHHRPYHAPGLVVKLREVLDLFYCLMEEQEGGSGPKSYFPATTLGTQLPLELHRLKTVSKRRQMSLSLCTAESLNSRTNSFK